MKLIREICIGCYFQHKWRARAAEVGHSVAAKAMRKQGIPLEMSLMILFGERP